MARLDNHQSDQDGKEPAHIIVNDRKTLPAALDGGADTGRLKDANGQSLAYVYGRETRADAHIARVLTEDEARRIASNIAKLPDLLGKGRPDDG